MTNRKSIFLCIILCAFLAACTSVGPLKHSDRCLPSFPDRDGWYGGDGAYSILLDDQRTLWLFGDTFVSNDIGRKDRIGMDVIMGNTLAVSTCSADQKFSIRYFLKKKTSKYVPFFGQNEMLWPQDPFIARGVLYIPLLVVQTLPDAPAPFNFKIAGHKIARITDVSNADPRKWPVEYLDWTAALPEDIEALATTSIVRKDHVYFYPLYRFKDGKGNILARIPLSRLENPIGAFEYLNRDEIWNKEFISDKVKIIFTAAVSELSVRFHPQEKKWLAVYLSAYDRGRKLLVQTASHLEGPWSAPLPLIESIPEVDPSTPLYHPGTFCYAGKEQHQFAAGRNLLVTYVCNSPDEAGFLRNNLFVYRPIAQSIACPPEIFY